MSPTTQSPDVPQAIGNIGRDIILWRNKKLSVSVLAVATVTWVLLEVYQFKFLTVVSWVTMSIVTLMFLWGNLLRLLGKEPPSLSGLEVSEQSARDIAITLKGCVEKRVRWMFWVGAESDWLAFSKVVGALWVLSLVGSWFDLLTLVYINIVMGLSVPVIYVKFEDKIKGCWERMRVQGGRCYEMVDEKLLRKIRHKIVVEKKGKKVE